MSTPSEIVDFAGLTETERQQLGDVVAIRASQIKCSLATGCRIQISYSHYIVDVSSICSGLRSESDLAGISPESIAFSPAKGGGGDRLRGMSALMYVKGTQLPSDSPCRQALDKACKKDLDKVMQISKDDVRKYEELPGFRFRRYQRVRDIPTADFEREVAPGIRTGR